MDQVRRVDWHYNSRMPTTLTVYGAAGEVTGSAYHVETDKASLLVDLGMFQGGRDADHKNRLPLPLRRKLDAVLLTHAHLDHTGRLPLLRKMNFNGPIHATPATIEMTGLILRDSAHVQAADIQRMNRRRERSGRPKLQPLYGPEEVEAILKQLQPVAYDQPVAVAPGIRAVFVEAGHMLGSSSIQLLIDDPGAPQPKRIVFSGDLGPRDAPTLREFHPFHQADLLLLESTYGDRDHRKFTDTVQEFTQIVKTVVERKGKILIPTFAVGRAQVLTLLLGYLFRNKIVPPFPVYLDSPMAAEAWKIFNQHRELFDADTLKFLRDGRLSEDLATLKITSTAEESKTINDCAGPCLVMAGAGMCNAGRILHHLRNNLWKPQTSVIIVGYQAAGSLGRLLVDGVKDVKIFGEWIRVAASIHTLGGFSAHAGQTDLMHWLAPAAGSRPGIVLTHGEDRARKPLAALIESTHKLSCSLPNFQDRFTL